MSPEMSLFSAIWLILFCTSWLISLIIWLIISSLLWWEFKCVDLLWDGTHPMVLCLQALRMTLGDIISDFLFIEYLFYINTNARRNFQTHKKKYKFWIGFQSRVSSLVYQHFYLIFNFFVNRKYTKESDVF